MACHIGSQREPMHCIIRYALLRLTVTISASAVISDDGLDALETCDPIGPSPHFLRFHSSLCSFILSMYVCPSLSFCPSVFLSVCLSLFPSTYSLQGFSFIYSSFPTVLVELGR